MFTERFFEEPNMVLLCDTNKPQIQHKKPDDFLSLQHWQCSSGSCIFTAGICTSTAMRSPLRAGKALCVWSVVSMCVRSCPQLLLCSGRLEPLYFSAKMQWVLIALSGLGVICTITQAYLGLDLLLSFTHVLGLTEHTWETSRSSGFPSEVVQWFTCSQN